MNPMTDDEAVEARKLVGEAVRFAVFAASLDEEFGPKEDRLVHLDVADPTIRVAHPQDWRRVAAMVCDRANAGDAIEISDNLPEEGGLLVPGQSEITIRWTHTTRTGRSYECSVYVLLDDE